MDHFTLTWRETLGKEGGYSNNGDDPGGVTCWGITEAVARHHGYKGDMADLDADRAKAIAKRAYWDALRLDDVAFLSPSIAREMFDTPAFLDCVGIIPRLAAFPKGRHVWSGVRRK